MNKIKYIKQDNFETPYRKLCIADYKVGDKIKIVQNVYSEESLAKGTIHTVTKIKSRDQSVWVEDRYFWLDEIRKVE